MEPDSCLQPPLSSFSYVSLITFQISLSVYKPLGRRGLLHAISKAEKSSTVEKKDALRPNRACLILAYYLNKNIPFSKMN